VLLDRTLLRRIARSPLFGFATATIDRTRAELQAEQATSFTTRKKRDRPASGFRACYNCYLWLHDASDRKITPVRWQNHLGHGILSVAAADAVRSGDKDAAGAANVQVPPSVKYGVSQFSLSRHGCGDLKGACLQTALGGAIT